MRRVVITGMGALTPIGNTVEEFWKNALEGVSGAAPIQTFDAAKFKTQFACELKDFKIEDHLDRKERKKYDKFTQYALVAVEEAVQQANIDFDNLDLDRVGVIWGSGNGGIQTFEQQLTEYNEGDGTPRFNPYFIPRILVDIAAGVISMKYGLRGVNFAPVSACATSTTAIIEAFNYVRWNKADMIVSGGSESPIGPATIGGFGSLKALSTKNDAPETASRPFDVNRDGFVMGEGAGALVVEELEHAKKRGANIIAEIVGGGMAADAYHLTGTHPEGEGAIKGMKLAIEEAGISPDQVDYVNMHATSTPNGDVSEIKALDTVFEKRKSLIVSGTKSMTGHLLGAAGAVETILSAKALEKQKVPPTINVKDFEESCKDSYYFPVEKGVDGRIKYALSNTFGFGGHIAALLLKRYEEE
ncbi:beta-ketoacyl-[acyl-carrier-protein] synthase II [Brumimicrobium salinarum]|uniref:3-oxoacyl-[acyl-carrier-protein] synthase 2 n=1 Tax=Brumimicrobium salinarum TaxID=2058658 RepID=A0A2I0R194_9FLAO|nr:beta-ketoacyl-ACP synthase II [Brumimicrobium salinarum]PKR80348.1 beta-ketoacyl-[acyl-carrier-protein] synthase II [Brumimicrobium salinarum]